MGRWRDAPYHGWSFVPRVNDFDGPVKRGSYGFGSGHRLDRIWFRGAVWTQCFMAGAARRFAEGRGYCLSDHFPVYGARQGVHVLLCA